MHLVMYKIYSHLVRVSQLPLQEEFMHLVMYLLTHQVRVSQLPLQEDFMHLVMYLLTRQVRVSYRYRRSLCTL